MDDGMDESCHADGNYLEAKFSDPAIVDPTKQTVASDLGGCDYWKLNAYCIKAICGEIDQDTIALCQKRTAEIEGCEVDCEWARRSALALPVAVQFLLFTWQLL